MYTQFVEATPAKKVLVVDDSPTYRAIIADALRTHGFHVITAVDGGEAVEKVLAERPDCIVLDVVLPMYNGFQLCRKLKTYEATKHIPVLLLSVKDTKLDRDWGLRQGADFYMTKPFAADKLLDHVRSLVWR